MNKMTPTQRLDKIRDMIEAVDRRCEAVDGPVTPTGKEITESELVRIYQLAKGEIKLKPLCPHCDRTVVQNCVYVENIGCGRIIREIDNGILIVENEYIAENFEDRKHQNPRLLCRSCGGWIELAEDQEIEFV